MNRFFFYCALAATAASCFLTGVALREGHLAPALIFAAPLIVLLLELLMIER